MTLRVRLNSEECANLQAMLANSNNQCANEGELIRLLLWREWNRRKRLGPPQPAQWQSAFRCGRPKAK